MPSPKSLPSDRLALATALLLMTTPGYGLVACSSAFASSSTVSPRPLAPSDLCGDRECPSGALGGGIRGAVRF
jgi:hypothetical protein